MNSPANFESTNIWDYKPRWCQPWSIILTGIVGAIGSWLVFHWLWLTVAVAVVIAVWWIYFLVIYPQAFAEYVKSQLPQTDANSAN